MATSLFSPTDREIGGAASAAEQREERVKALLIERDGYIARGLGSRVQAVEDQLVFYGYELVERADAIPPVVERATKRR